MQMMMRRRPRAKVQAAPAIDQPTDLRSWVSALQRDPGNADLHASISGQLSDLGRYDEAIGAGLLAAEFGPDNPRAHAELGRALFLAGQADSALGSCARAVTLDPRNLGAMVTLGAVLFALGHMEAALEVAGGAVAINPDHFKARTNLALALEALGRLDEAEAQSRKAVALDPASAAGRHNLAGLLLSCGKLDAESWQLYEARLGLTEHSRRLAAVPRWRGEDIAGKTVLLHAEQGFGDVIQFSRYAALVKQRGARVVLAVPVPLMRLMSGLAGVDEVVCIGALPAFDVFCPLASLPGVFGTTLDTIPGLDPYLSVPLEAADRFRIAASGSLQVGLVWSGNPGFVHDRLRSIAADSLCVLADVPGVQFHCLQKDVIPPFAMSNRMDEVTDFADTAALIGGLDLVIAVDTAVAHLAAALGKPVWMLSRFMGCWRWLRDRDDSPWYPTLRIFRQQRAQDWDGALARVRDALVARAALSAYPR